MFGDNKIDELIKVMNKNNQNLIASIDRLTETMKKPSKRKKRTEDIDTENKIVNWSNCKTPQQQIMKFWVFSYLPESYNGYTAKEYREFIRKHGKEISGILNQCREDVDMACKVISMSGANLSSKGLDWSLFAVNKHCADYVNALRRNNANTNR